MQQPADIANRALDALGCDKIIGTFDDGTHESDVLARTYDPTLRALLRSAYWNFSRKMAPLQLLADATGNTRDLATGQPISMIVEQPWTYAYAWPIDGVRARWLPWTQQSPPQAVPLMTNLSPARGGRLIPARFLVSASDQYPIGAGQIDWDDLPELEDIEGVGILNRRIVLTNAPNANLVYTKLTLDPSEWDALFGEAMVATLAARTALALLIDPDASEAVRLKQRAAAMQTRAAQVAIAKDMISQARVANANDSGWPSSIDHEADWIRARTSGGPYWNLIDASAGVLRYGWEGISFGAGTVF